MLLARNALLHLVECGLHAKTYGLLLIVLSVNLIEVSSAGRTP